MKIELNDIQLNEIAQKAIVELKKKMPLSGAKFLNDAISLDIGKTV